MLQKPMLANGRTNFKRDFNIVYYMYTDTCSCFKYN